MIFIDLRLFWRILNLLVSLSDSTLELGQSRINGLKLLLSDSEIKVDKIYINEGAFETDHKFDS